MSSCSVNISVQSIFLEYLSSTLQLIGNWAGGSQSTFKTIWLVESRLAQQWQAMCGNWCWRDVYNQDEVRYFRYTREGGQRSCSEMMRCDSQAWGESPCSVLFENVWYANANIWCVLGKCKPMNFSLHVISQTQGCSLKGSFPKTTGNFLLLKAEVQVEIFF